MKLKITFTDGFKDYSTIIKVEEPTLSELISNKALPRIFKEERELEKKHKKVMQIKGIKDMD